MAKKNPARRRALQEVQDRSGNPYSSPRDAAGSQPIRVLPYASPNLGRLTWPRDAILCAGLALLIALVYWPVARNDFINYDDDGYVVENEFVAPGLTYNGICWAMTSLDQANWHPLTWLSHMLDCQLFGLKPAGHHLVSLGLHILNSGLLYYVLLRMTRAVWPSLVVAAFFAVHPLHVESVAWVAERKDVLSTLFGLLALGFWLGYLARPSLVRYTAVMLWFAASLMAKPMWVTLPFLLLLADYWPLERWQRAGSRERGTGREERGAGSGTNFADRSVASVAGLVLEKLPLMLISAASCIVTMIAQSLGHAVVPLTSHSPGARLATVAQAYCGYLGQMAVPLKLAPIYPLSKSTNYPVAIACGLALLLITILVVRGGRARRYLAVGWFWYLGMLVPVIGIVHVGLQSMADRYSYMPLVGIFVLLSWSAVDAIARWPRLKRPLIALTVSALVACCLLAHAQVCRWESTETLFTHTAAVTPDNPVALTNLGLVAIHKDDYAEARRLLEEALRIDPAHIDALGNLASMYVKQKNYDAAIKAYEQINYYCPKNIKVYGQMAKAFTEQGNHRQAEVWLRQAVALQPASVSLHYRLAFVQQSLGETREALENYSETLRLKPGERGTSNNVAWIYSTHPDPQFRNGAKAIELLQPLAAKPDNDQDLANLLDTLAAAYAEAGRFEEALKTAETAIDKARSGGNIPVSIAEMEQRAALYKKLQPYRDQQLLGQPSRLQPGAAGAIKRE